MLVSREGEHGEGDGDGKIDSNLTCLNLSLELASGMSILCEDSCSIAKLIVVNEFDGLLECRTADNLHNWSENLFLIAVNTSSHMIDNSWSDKVAIRVAWHIGLSSVEKHFTILCTVSDQALDLSQMLSIVEGSHIGVVPASTNGESLGLFNNFWNPLLSVTDHDNNSDSHASLSGRAETRSDTSIDRVLLVSIRHDNSMVLGTHIDLCAFAMSTGCRVDVLSCLVGSNEADASDVLVLADLCHGVASTLDHVDDAIGDT